MLRVLYYRNGFEGLRKVLLKWFFLKLVLWREKNEKYGGRGSLGKLREKKDWE